MQLKLISISEQNFKRGIAGMKNQRVLIKICQMYYEENLSQKEISQQLGISRPQVSRMLTTARENNIVSIKINNPYLDETVLERKLMSAYKLTDALVLNTAGVDEGGRLEEFGRMAAEHLENYIADGDTVGVMSGQTVSHLVRGIRHFPRRRLKIVPLVGGLGSRNFDWHANSIARTFAEHSGGSCYTLNAPAVMQNEEARALLVGEPDIASVLKLGASCGVTIVGIGQVSNNATNVVAGGLSSRDISTLRKTGAVGSICTSYLNRKGEIVQGEISRRLIGQTLEDISRSKTIAVAIGGSKVEAIKASLLSGYVDVFITNLETAHNIFYQNDESKEEVQ